MITGGFGFEYDHKRGVSRAWIYKDGVKRWVDDGSPVDPPDDPPSDPSKK